MLVLDIAPGRRHRGTTEGVVYLVLLYHSFGCRDIRVAISPLILSFSGQLFYVMSETLFTSF